MAPRWRREDRIAHRGEQTQVGLHDPLGVADDQVNIRVRVQQFRLESRLPRRPGVVGVEEGDQAPGGEAQAVVACRAGPGWAARRT